MPSNTPSMTRACGFCRPSPSWRRAWSPPVRVAAPAFPSWTALLDDRRVEVIPFDDAQVIIARNAFIRYGKRRHPARLNFGDCAAYALAIAESEPLLFKGTDFGATDVEVMGAG